MTSNDVTEEARPEEARTEDEPRESEQAPALELGDETLSDLTSEADVVGGYDGTSKCTSF